MASEYPLTCPRTCHDSPCRDSDKQLLRQRRLPHLSKEKETSRQVNYKTKSIFSGLPHQQEGEEQRRVAQTDRQHCKVRSTRERLRFPGNARSTRQARVVLHHMFSATPLTKICGRAAQWLAGFYRLHVMRDWGVGSVVGKSTVTHPGQHHVRATCPVRGAVITGGCGTQCDKTGARSQECGKEMTPNGAI